MFVCTSVNCDIIIWWLILRFFSFDFWCLDAPVKELTWRVCGMFS